MSTTTIPNTSAFPTMPAFPSIRAQADTVSVTQSPAPELNRIYFNKKQLADTYRELHTDKSPTIRHIWEIPFSCDADTPVTELTRRIDAAMEKTMSYSDWTIDYSQFIIKAVEK